MGINDEGQPTATLLAPGGAAAVRSFAEQQRRLMHGEIRQLDAIIRDLTPPGFAAGSTEAKPAAAKAKPKRTRSSPNQMGKVAAAANRDKVASLLLGRGEEMSPRQIKAEVPMSPSQATSVFKKLTEEGRIRRNGPPTFPTYEAIVKPGSTPTGQIAPPVRDTDGATRGGRILGYLTSTGGATEAALAEHLDLETDVVRAECGTLIREGEIRFDRTDGVTRFVPETSA